jgi:hypothetical protein
MNRYAVSLIVRVYVDAVSPAEAERIAFEQRRELIQGPTALATATMHAVLATERKGGSS